MLQGNADEELSRLDVVNAIPNLRKASRIQITATIRSTFGILIGEFITELAGKTS
jgi:hypothetical protein